LKDDDYDDDTGVQTGNYIKQFKSHIERIPYTLHLSNSYDQEMSDRIFHMKLL